MIRLVAIFMAALLSAAPVFSEQTEKSIICQDHQLSLVWNGGEANFKTEIADTPESRAKGLMFVESMPRFSSMLFVYEAPQPQIAFWMRNTLIPLDILYFDHQGVLKHIHENAIPMDETPLPGGPGIQYVLEINGGMSKLLRIKEGAHLVSPAINQDQAIRPCGKSK